MGGYVLVNHCLFNVEGGHRAVMYSRFSGMSPVVRGEVIVFLVLGVVVFDACAVFF